MIIKLFEKYCYLDEPKNLAVKAKLKDVKTFDEGIEILVKNGWFIGNQLIDKMKADPMYAKIEKSEDISKEVKKIDESKEKDAIKIAQLEADKSKIQKEILDDGQKAKKQGEY